MHDMYLEHCILAPIPGMSGLLTIGMGRGLACKLLKPDEQGNPAYGIHTSLK